MVTGRGVKQGEDLDRERRDTGRGFRKGEE